MAFLHALRVPVSGNQPSQYTDLHTTITAEHQIRSGLFYCKLLSWSTSMEIMFLLLRGLFIIAESVSRNKGWVIGSTEILKDFLKFLIFARYIAGVKPPCRWFEVARNNSPPPCMSLKKQDKVGPNSKQRKMIPSKSKWNWW